MNPRWGTAERRGAPSVMLRTAMYQTEGYQDLGRHFCPRANAEAFEILDWRVGREGDRCGGFPELEGEGCCMGISLPLA